MTRTPLQVTLPTLLTKSLAAGWRVLVRVPDPGRRDWLDEVLWLQPKDGFLPHGREGEGREADQPVLIAGPEAGLADRSALVSIDGAPLAPEEVSRAARCMVLFDGTDEGAVEAARGQWRALTQAGCQAQYWSQEGGGWGMKAESGGAT